MFGSLTAFDGGEEEMGGKQKCRRSRHRLNGSTPYAPADLSLCLSAPSMQLPPPLHLHQFMPRALTLPQLRPLPLQLPLLLLLLLHQSLLLRCGYRRQNANKTKAKCKQRQARLANVAVINVISTRRATAVQQARGTFPGHAGHIRVMFSPRFCSFQLIALWHICTWRGDGFS